MSAERGDIDIELKIRKYSSEIVRFQSDIQRPDPALLIDRAARDVAAANVGAFASAPRSQRLIDLTGSFENGGRTTSDGLAGTMLVSHGRTAVTYDDEGRGTNQLTAIPIFTNTWAEIFSGIGFGFAGIRGIGGRGVAPTPASPSVGREIGILRDAAVGKGSFGLGSAPRATADRLGQAWVGSGHKTASDGKTLISADGLRQYRPPTFKPNQDAVQANFEWRLVPSGQWQGNGHLTISE